MDRRKFIKINSDIFMGAGILLSSPAFLNFHYENPLFFKISLAQWSMHRTIRSGKLNTLDFPLVAKKDFDIHAVEYVNQFFMGKAKDKTFLRELKKRTNDNGVKNVLIMIDAEGELGNRKNIDRLKAVENHYKWIEAAQFLGCSSIRVNAIGEGNKEDVAKKVEDSLHQLATYARDYKINVIVENHGKISSNAIWLTEIIKNVGLENCGTLPDFGNFLDFDKYEGVKLMMPFAKGVSAKSNRFDKDGKETEINYVKMLQIVKDAGYKGYIGIEYEGENNDEYWGIKATKELLVKASSQLN